jgi:hypothetical protein
MRALIFFTSLFCLCCLIVWASCELIVRTQ